MKYIKLFKSLIIVAPVLALVSPLMILSNTGCGNPRPEGTYLPDGSNWVGRTGGTLNYDIDDENHTYRIISNNNFTTNSSFTIPNAVGINNKQYLVTTIGTGAFYGCTGLTGIDLGSVTTIGTDAFGNCPLKEVNVDLDNSEYKLVGTSTNGFIRKTGETATLSPACGTSGGVACGNIVIPEGVTSISANAFYRCANLTGVDLNGVTGIDDNAFYGCPFKEVSVNSSNSIYKLVGTPFDGFIQKKNDDTTLTPVCGNWGGIACGNIIIPGNVTTIGDMAFYECTGLTGVDFNNVTTIGRWAFNECTGLTGADFVNVTTIGITAFQGCMGLIWVDLSNVTTLGMDWCLRCVNLSSVTIGAQTYSSSDDGWDDVGPDTGCILYAPTQPAADAFKTNVIGTAYAGKWTFEQI